MTINRIGKLSWVVFRTLMIIGISFVILWPLIWLLHYSFIELKDTRDMTVIYIPKNFTMGHFIKVFEFLEYPKAFSNSFFLSITVAILQVVSCNLIGYGFARFNFKGSKILLALVVFVLIIPPQTIMVSIYLYYRQISLFGLANILSNSPGILDTMLPFWLQAATGFGIKNGLYILIFMQIYKTMPKEIEESAMVDGAGVLKVYRRIMLPNSKSGNIAIFLFSFVWQWNDSYFVSMYLNNTVVLPNKLATIGTTITTALGQIDPMLITIYTNAATLLSILPVLIIYIFMQKHFVESVERTGIVG